MIDYPEQQKNSNDLKFKFLQGCKSSHLFSTEINFEIL